MAKSKTRGEIEHLKGLIRNLKAQIRHLKKDMGRKEKREHLYQDLEEKEAEILVHEEFAERKLLKQNVCPKCQSEVEVFGGSKIKVYNCISCGHRFTKRT